MITPDHPSIIVSLLLGGIIYLAGIVAGVLALVAASDWSGVAEWVMTQI